MCREPEQSIPPPRHRSQRITAGVVGIAVFVAAVWVVTTAGSFDRTTTPADQPTENLPGKTAVDVAADFFIAYSFSNEDQAVSMLADDVDLSGFNPMLGGNLGPYLDGTRDFRLLMRFWDAMGFTHILDSCVEASRLPLGTVVRLYVRVRRPRV